MLNSVQVPALVTVLTWEGAQLWPGLETPGFDPLTYSCRQCMSTAIGDGGVDRLTNSLSYHEHPLSLLTVKWGEAWRMGGNRAARRRGMNPLPHHPIWRTNYAQDGPGFPIYPACCNFRPSSSHCPHTSRPLTPETLPFSLF